MPLSQDDLKRQVALAALLYVPQGQVIGVGTGSTADMFIDCLAGMKDRISGAVASSERSAARMRGHGITVLDLNQVSTLAVYIDGADEVDDGLNMIKGGGGALSREKIVASVAQQFVCIADASKLVNVLGAFALPVEVLPMARAAIARQLSALGGQPKLRTHADGSVYLTDNQCEILDVSGLQITQPALIESRINQWPGVITNGLFALRGADVVLLGTQEGVRTLKRATALH